MLSRRLQARFGMICQRHVLRLYECSTHMGGMTAQFHWKGVHLVVEQWCKGMFGRHLRYFAKPMAVTNVSLKVPVLMVIFGFGIGMTVLLVP